MSDEELAKTKAPGPPHPHRPRRRRDHLQRPGRHASRSSSGRCDRRYLLAARSRSGTTRASRPSTRASPPRHRRPRRAPFRWQRHDVHFLRLPGGRQPRPGPRRPAGGKSCSGPLGWAAKEMKGSPARSSRLPERSAMSSWPTRSRTACPYACDEERHRRVRCAVDRVGHRRRRGAAASLPPNTDFRVSIVNCAGRDAYPISSLHLSADPQDAHRRRQGQEDRRLHEMGAQ